MGYSIGYWEWYWELFGVNVAPVRPHFLYIKGYTDTQGYTPGYTPGCCLIYSVNSVLCETHAETPPLCFRVRFMILPSRTAQVTDT